MDAYPSLFNCLSFSGTPGYSHTQSSRLLGNLAPLLGLIKVPSCGVGMEYERNTISKPIIFKAGLISGEVRARQVSEISFHCKPNDPLSADGFPAGHDFCTRNASVPVPDFAALDRLVSFGSTTGCINFKKISQ